MESHATEGSPVKAGDETMGHNFFFHGNGGTLFGIQIINLLLVIVTFGIYYFWGKARVRRYLWGQADFNGDRFSYHGTGRETFQGFLKAALIFGVPFYFFQNVPLLIGASVPIQVIGVLISLLLVSVFIPFAIVGTRRYRLSRSALRGVRFSFRGRWRDFARLYFTCMTYVALTLGFYMPYYEMRKNRFLWERTYFGNKRFGFDGKGSDLSGSYIAAILLAIPTLALSLIWYSYRKNQYVWNHTTFDAVRFYSHVTFGGVLWLDFINGLLLICTLGFASSWVKVRSLRYYMEHLTLEGQLDLAAIVQDAQEVTATGEEIGDFLDTDLDLG